MKQAIDRFGAKIMLLGLVVLAAGACVTRSKSIVPQAMSASTGIVGRSIEEAVPSTGLSRILTTEWPGPYGGLPPVHLANPKVIEAAFIHAIDDRRREVQRIAEQQDHPTFENTISALEASGRVVDRIDALFNIFKMTASSEDVRATAARLAPLRPRLEDDIAHNAKLFTRINAIHAGLPQSAPTSEARRLVAVVRDDFVRRGANLDAKAKARLSEMNARLAELQTKFSQNVEKAPELLVIFVNDKGQLDGLSNEYIENAKAAAAGRGRPNAWAIPITRASVWPVLTNASSRQLREKVWLTWASRAGDGGPNDNSLVMTEILKLRGEKAKLLGYSSFAHYQTSARMAGTPETAMGMLMRTWRPVLEHTRTEIRSLQKIADAEGADFAIQPWDRLYYAEKYRQQEFNFRSESVKPYLELENVIRAMLWAAERVYDYKFRELYDIPVISPDIRVFEVTRDNEVAGLLWMDLFEREGKVGGSVATQYRSAETFRGKVTPLVALHSGVSRPPDGGPVLLPWERANVIFHEFGHTLQTLSNKAAYPSLGALKAPWDFIEVPSLLNERWLMDRELLSRFARHHKTGEPMSADLIVRLEKAAKHDRVFSVTLDYLSTAITDMRLHMLADGREIEAVVEEKKILKELGMPEAITPTLRVYHASHTFSQEYAAGVYTYLWSDIIAADIAEAFLQAPGGLYDKRIARKWRSEILDVAFTVPTVDAFRAFRGRDPNPAALLRRFDLIAG